MTTAFQFQPAPARSGVSPAAAVAIVVVAAVAFLTLITAGFTFVGFAIAFPLAVPVAEYFNVVVTSTDIAIAQQAAGFWWAFALLAVASLGAAVLVVVAAIKALTPTARS
jgi:hypothetical protein